MIQIRGNRDLDYSDGDKMEKRQTNLRCWFNSKPYNLLLGWIQKISMREEIKGISTFLTCTAGKMAVLATEW